MDGVRAPFASAEQLVVIHTGPWNHLRMGGANAWTAMPGQSPAGAVLESPVAANANITAHELGHYLGLDHARGQYSLMNPVIFSRSTRLTPGECEKMRKTAVGFHFRAIRDS
jgi:hypothetical protein